MKIRKVVAALILGGSHLTVAHALGVSRGGLSGVHGSQESGAGHQHGISLGWQWKHGVNDEAQGVFGCGWCFAGGGTVICRRREAWGQGPVEAKPARRVVTVKVVDSVTGKPADGVIVAVGGDPVTGAMVAPWRLGRRWRWGRSG